MTDSPRPSSQPAAIPADDPKRNLVHVRPDDPNLPHTGLVGDPYTVLLTGKDTAGRYCLIDMYVPPCGGPSAHRHDFEEMLTLLEGEIELTLRGAHSIPRDNANGADPGTSRSAKCMPVAWRQMRLVGLADDSKIIPSIVRPAVSRRPEVL